MIAAMTDNPAIRQPFRACLKELQFARFPVFGASYGR